MKSALEKFIEREGKEYSDKWVPDNDPEASLNITKAITTVAKESHTAGANSLAPLLIEAVEALDTLACWDEGEEVNAGFDNPGDAEFARKTLARIRGKLK